MIYYRGSHDWCLRSKFTPDWSSIALHSSLVTDTEGPVSPGGQGSPQRTLELVLFQILHKSLYSINMYLVHYFVTRSCHYKYALSRYKLFQEYVFYLYPGYTDMLWSLTMHVYSTNTQNVRRGGEGFAYSLQDKQSSTQVPCSMVVHHSNFLLFNFILYLYIHTLLFFLRINFVTFCKMFCLFFNHFWTYNSRIYFLRSSCFLWQVHVGMQV